MNFISETEKFCISDKGRMYRKHRKKRNSNIEYVKMGSIRPESNAPIRSIEMLKFHELQPDDLREIADMVDEYVDKVYGDPAPVFVGHRIGIVGT